jgi:hypothetical protein
MTIIYSSLFERIQSGLLTDPTQGSPTPVAGLSGDGFGHRCLFTVTLRDRICSTAPALVAMVCSSGHC